MMVYFIFYGILDRVYFPENGIRSMQKIAHAYHTLHFNQNVDIFHLL